MTDRQPIADEPAISGLLAHLSKLGRIRSGSQHRLYRGRISGTSVVVKASSAGVPPEGAGASLAQEYEILRELKLPGIVNVLAVAPMEGGLALLMEDAGDTNLAELMGSRRLSIGEFLDIAVQLADSVARMHGARIVHRHIQPGNIVWDSKGATATLCDFAIARTFPALSVENRNARRLEGALSYMSPEQTGRTGLSIDWRTDLYSLGATFYEMLTGAPPFAEADVVALAHAQIARRPEPPHEINPQVPLTLSRIVLKLLEKEPEQRYQSGAALADDLRKVREQWVRSASIEPFQLASSEVPQGLRIPGKLYGRDEELQHLTDAFSQACSGAREFLLVTGGPGVGKTALVERLRPQVTARQGFYASGKFDQLQRSVPFSGLAQALRSMVGQLLTETEAALERWREQIQDAVAPNGQLLVALVPELENILGPQAPVPEVGPVEARNRFHALLTRFLRVFAQPDHPLVIFLDDLQWADAASLQLLEQWVGDAASHHVLLIAAYRDNEVGPSHALALFLSALGAAGIGIQEIHLEPLRSEAVAQLAAETFGEDPGRMRPLADLLLRKSAGNPFFVRRLLHSMHAQDLFRFHAPSHRWTWDESTIEQAPISDNVLDLMVQAIDRLPRATKRHLEMGACIGHRFDLGTLAELGGLSRATVIEALWPAIEDGLVVATPDASEPAFRFVHDRVQQAAYGLLNQQDRQALHHAIGLRLLAQAGDDLAEVLFEIVDQLDLGEAHIVDEAERRSLVDLNLAAGRKAKASAAYRAAFEYLMVARRNLGEQAWIDRPGITFAVHRELAESAYLAGEHDMAEDLVETSLAHAPTKVAKADLYGLRVLAATVASDWPRALRWGREGLSVFGSEWPLDGLPELIEAEAAAVMRNLRGRRIEDLVHEPEVQDEEIRACMRLISILGAPAYFSGADVLIFLVTRAANLSLLHGPSAYSAFAYTFYGGIHNMRTGRYDVGYEFGKLALALANRFGNRAEECRTVEVFGVIVHGWKAPLRDSLPLLKEGFRAGVESGELAFAAFNLNCVLINGLPSGLPLKELMSEAEVAIDFAVTQKNKASAEMAVPFLQLARALTGATSRPGTFDDGDFAESRFLEEARNHETALGHYWVAKLQLACLMGEHADALECSQEAARRIPTGIRGMFTSAEHVFYTALTLASAPAPGGHPSSSLDELRGLHAKLVNWAAYCPQNFSHKASLVQAEIARLAGAHGEAMGFYRAAIDEAQRHQFTQDEAIAHELRARFLLGAGEAALASVEFRSARDGYRRWGATAKVESLEKDHPQCFASDAAGPHQGISIDALALIKASQAISAQTLPDKLFEQILRVVAEVAGAQRGALVFSTGGLPTVRARIEASDGLPVSLAEAPLAQCPDLPAAVLRYAIRTREVVLLSDAASAGQFSGDPVVQQRGLRSVLCVPLSKQAAVIGLLYLENNALTGAFTNELVEVVQVLAAQAVISLENSILLGELQELTGALEERVAERTKQLTDQIHERDKAQAALRELSQTLEQKVAQRTADRNALWQLTRDLMLRCTFDGRITAVNPAWTEILGWQENELVGSSLFDFVHPDDLYHTAQGARDLSEGKSHDRFDNRYRHRDGTYRWISWSTRSSEGFITATGRDVTREIEQSQALAVAGEQLRQSQKMEAVGQLTGGLAHDFNNLLGGMSASLQVLAARLADGRAEGLERYVRMCQESLRRASSLTQRLLAFARRQTLDPRPIDVNRLVGSLEELIRRTVGPSIEVEVVGAAGLWLTRLDASQLENSLLNLCINARDAMMPGGGRLTIETANKWLDERAARERELTPGQYISLCVTDTGTGMPREVADRAFDPFYTTKPMGKGTGLGLSMVYGFARQSGGQIRIYSEVGVGTTMCLYLPRHFGEIEPQPAPALASAARPGHGETIAVIEDEDNIRLILLEVLEAEGYRVLAAADAQQGLRLLQSSERIDLLLTDVGLPGGMNGRQLADAGRALRPDMKVVFATGYAENAVVGNGHLERGMELVTKPFEIAALLGKIRDMLDRNHATRPQARP